MDTKPLIRWLATLSLILSWGLASCAPSVIAQGQPKPTANSASAYPGPTSVHPLPTQANGKIDRSAGLLVTPLPDEKVQLGTITEIQSLPPELQLPDTTHFSTKSWEKGEGQNAIKALAVVDSLTQREVRLGNDAGYATFRGRSAEIILWKWECECGDPQPGLYAYSATTDKNIFIADTTGLYPEVEGQWVGYINHLLPTGAELHAHNLVTGEDLLITQNMAPKDRSSGLGDYYALQGNKIVWVEDESVQHNNEIYWGLHVYDLTTHTLTILALPGPMGSPFYLSLFGDLVIWLQDFWQGYDLKNNAYFTIPVIPPGWENASIHDGSPVTAQGNRLYWAFKVDDEFHYFTAPIVSKGQGAQPTHSVPTPHRKPTQSPVPPIPTSFSTAYP